MTERPADHIPTGTTAAAPTRGRRGGARPGAGAPKGNVNGLKHGRRSRFKDLLPLPPAEPLAIARRLLLKERREAERHAVVLLQTARAAQYERDRAAAIAEGRPLPPPPLRDLESIRDRAFARFANSLIQHALLERARLAGKLTADSPAIAKRLATAEKADLLVAHTSRALDQALAAGLSPAALAALLPIPTSNQPSNQTRAPALESVAAPTGTPADSPRVQKNPDIQSIGPKPARHPRRRPRRQGPPPSGP